MTVIHWFRRDLRLTDNTALIEAMKSGNDVIPIFIFDPAILNGRNYSDTRMAFLYIGLQTLAEKIHEQGGKLQFYRGNPLKLLPQIANETGAKALYFNRDYTPYAQKRDQQMRSILEIPVYGFDDALIMPPGSVLTNEGNPYSVYTPFKNKWRKLSQARNFTIETKVIGRFYDDGQINGHNLPEPNDLNLHTAIHLPEAGENTAQKQLKHFVSEQIYDYSNSRNELTRHPFIESGGTSQLSPYFRFGMLSPRQAIAAARQAYLQTENLDEQESVITWVDELIWREFYMHIMSHFPQVYSGNFRSEYDNLAWENNPDALTRWKNGETGYPIVDAAMRQLKVTGWMPNRARMIVSSFLTKDLLINWREGEQHFMRYLLDGDPAANNGGWQWAAGTGTDAQPYFRIFNPISQSQRFDPTGDYIREWVPELADLSDKAIHAPSEIKNPPKNYPQPIVNHKEAREKTLAAFKTARE